MSTSLSRQRAATLRQKASRKRCLIAPQRQAPIRTDGSGSSSARKTVSSMPATNLSECSGRCIGRRALFRSGLLRAVAAEIGIGAVLARIDNAASDRARAREQIEERIAVAPADCTLQHAQILAEAAQDLQDRFAVVEEHVAPH